MKRWLISILFLSCYLFSAEDELPLIIDFSQFKSSQIDPFYEPESWKFGHAAFNFAPEIIPFFVYLQKNYQIEAVVETGTFAGASSQLFSLLFEEVYTIEIHPKTFERANNNLKNFENVHLFLGASEEILPQILPALKDKRLLFYLDAHWEKKFPLKAELQVIEKTHKNNCIIVIDDFQVPGRKDIPYDAYAGGSCSYTYIKPELDQLFTEYTIHYLIPKSVKSRAKLVVIPK